MDDDLALILEQLLVEWESELVEFKQADNKYSTSRIGEYFSALANEANLKDVDRGWLVFGVNDKSRRVVGSNYRVELAHLNSLKMQIVDDTTPPMTFRDIHEVEHENGRVIMFEVPAAPAGMPVAWKGY